MVFIYWLVFVCLFVWSLFINIHVFWWIFWVLHWKAWHLMPNWVYTETDMMQREKDTIFELFRFFCVLCCLLTVCHKHKSFIRTMLRSVFTFTQTKCTAACTRFSKCVVFDLSCLVAFAFFFDLIFFFSLPLFNPVTGVHTLRMKFMAHHNHNNVTMCRKECVIARDVADRWYTVWIK